MLMSIGISVEFIAHPVAAYEFSEGTRNERLAQARLRCTLTRSTTTSRHASHTR